jgi:2-amino-4-hydroxy-6-hydroxymethyldihydropteridine diphosphokinase
MTVSYIGIGSNVGDRIHFSRRAVEELTRAEGVEVSAISSFYETSPVGGPPQRSFINMVVRISTQLEPRALLELCKRIEDRIGREPSEIKWGPRVIDLDVLTYGEEKTNEPDLEIPHPRMTQRRFVLVPLLEIDPEATDPWGTPYAQWVDEAEGEVHLLEPFSP